MDRAVCPNCGAVLATVPRRRVVCRKCGNGISVRGTQVYYPGRSLFSDADAHALDDFKKWDVGVKEFADCGNAMASERGREPSLRDVWWRVMNLRVTRTASHFERRTSDFSMARFRYEEGGDPFPLLGQSARAQLDEWCDAHRVGLIDNRRVHVMTAGPASCGVCRRLEGQSVPMQEALADCPVPVHMCEHEKSTGGYGWCRCVLGITSS
jgi:hypothetical protein